MVKESAHVAELKARWSGSEVHVQTPSQAASLGSV